MEKAQSKSSIANYIGHHGVLHINKPRKLQKVFNAPVKFHNTSLNDNLLTAVDFLYNLQTFIFVYEKGVNFHKNTMT